MVFLSIFESITDTGVCQSTPSDRTNNGSSPMRRYSNMSSSDVNSIASSRNDERSHQHHHHSHHQHRRRSRKSWLSPPPSDFGSPRSRSEKRRNSNSSNQSSNNLIIPPRRLSMRTTEEWLSATPIQVIAPEPPTSGVPNNRKSNLHLHRIYSEGGSLLASIPPDMTETMHSGFAEDYKHDLSPDCSHGSLNYEGSFEEQQLRTENRRLQEELIQVQQTCASLEQQFWNKRDELAYVKATYNSQFHEKLASSQEEKVRHARKAEKEENDALLREFEELKSQVEQPTQTLSSVKKELEDERIKHQKQQTKWEKERQALVSSNDNLKATLRDTEEKIEFLEAQIEVLCQLQENGEMGMASGNTTNNNKNIKGNNHGDDNDVLNTTGASSTSNAVWQAQKQHFEDQLDVLVEDNLELTQQAEKVPGLQAQIEELEMQQVMTCRQLQDWKNQTQTYKSEYVVLEKKLAKELATKEVFREEWADRIEELENKNQELSQKLEATQEKDTHQLQLQKRTIQSLQAKLSEVRKQSGVQFEDQPQPSSSTKSTSRGFSLSSLYPTATIKEEQPKDSRTVSTEDTYLLGEENSSANSASLETQLEEAKNSNKLLQQKLEKLSEDLALSEHATAEARHQVGLLQTFLSDGNYIHESTPLSKDLAKMGSKAATPTTHGSSPSAKVFTDDDDDDDEGDDRDVQQQPISMISVRSNPVDGGNDDDNASASTERKGTLSNKSPKAQKIQERMITEQAQLNERHLERMEKLQDHVRLILQWVPKQN